MMKFLKECNSNGHLMIFKLSLMSVFFASVLSLFGGAREFPRPQISKVPGQPIEWQWPDGRKARLVVSIYGPQFLPIAAQLIDNSCSEVFEAVCVARAGFKFYHAALIWVENPLNPERVGKVVQQRSDPSAVEHVFFASMFKKNFVKSSYYQDVPNDTLECSDWSWVDGQTVQAPPQLETPWWWGENSYTNPETGVDETVVYGTLSKVFWQRKDNFTLQVSRIDGSYTSALGNQDNDFIYQSSNTLLLKKGGEFCGATFRMDFVSFLAATAHMPDQPAQPIDYRYQQDDLYESTLASRYSSGFFLFSSAGEPYEVF